MSIAGAFTPTSLMKAGFKKIDGIKLLNITPLIISANFFSLLFNIFSMITTILVLIVLRPDIVVISVPPGQAALGVFSIAKLFRKKIVFDYRDEWEDHVIGICKSKTDKTAFDIFKRIMSWCYQQSDKVAVVTETIRQKFIERNVKNTEVILNGADCDIFKPYLDEKSKIRDLLGFSDDDFILIFSGNIVGYYRVDLIIKALKMVNLTLTKIKLIIVGYALPSDIRDLNCLISDLGLQNNIKYLGTKYDKTDLAKLISCCDVGIVPYDGNPLWKNSLPAKSFEYFACGLPIIATAYSDSLLGKLIESNNIGIVSEPESVECLASSIIKMYHSDIESTGKRAVSLMNTTYNRNIIAIKFLKILEDLHNS